MILTDIESGVVELVLQIVHRRKREVQMELMELDIREREMRTTSRNDISGIDGEGI